MVTASVEAHVDAGLLGFNIALCAWQGQELLHHHLDAATSEFAVCFHATAAGSAGLETLQLAEHDGAENALPLTAIAGLHTVHMSQLFVCSVTSCNVGDRTLANLAKE